MKTHEYEHELESLSHKTHTAKPILGGFLVGSVIGVATALLFAPRSGQETRSDLRHRAVELRDRTTETVKDTVSQAKSKASALKDTVREKAEELTHRSRQTVDRQVDEISGAVASGKQYLQDS